MSFIHLQVRSGYSLLSSTVKIEELVTRARELQFSAVALTDENVLYGVIPFYEACKAYGIKPIIGMIATVMNEHDDTDQLVLLAKNNRGYRQLVQIATIIQMNGGKGISLSHLSGYTSELIGMTSGVHGRIEQHLLNGEIARAEALAQMYTEIFQQGDFYINVQQHGLPEQAKLLPLLLEYSRRWNIPIVATNDVRYIYKEDALACECLLAMKHGKKMNDPSRPRFSTNEYDLKSADEMISLFSMYPLGLKAHTFGRHQAARFQIASDDLYAVQCYQSFARSSLNFSAQVNQILIIRVVQAHPSHIASHMLSFVRFEEGRCPLTDVD